MIYLLIINFMLFSLTTMRTMLLHCHIMVNI